MTPQEFISDNSGLTQILLIGAGVILLLAGGKLSQTLVRIVGFVIGGAIGAYLSLNFTDQIPGVITIVGFLVGGLIGGVVALFLAGLGMFLLGLAIGAISVGPVYTLVFQEEPSTLVAVAGALIIGILFIGLYRFWIVGITSLIGAVLVGSGLSLEPTWWALFFVAGLAAQYLLGRRSPQKWIAIPKQAGAKTAFAGGSGQLVTADGEYLEQDPLQIARDQLTAGAITAKEFKKIKRKHRPYRD